jgi:rod shape determining protein RodA
MGTSLMLLLGILDYRKLGPYAWVIFFCSLLLLILVLIVGKRINGAKSWLPIAGGFSLQPSEFAKISVIFMLSWYASRPYTKMDRLSGLIPCLGIMSVPFILILLQPDLGSAMVLLPICITILFVSGLRIRWMVYGLIFAILATPLIYKFGLKEHQKKKIDNFFESIE